MQNIVLGLAIGDNQNADAEGIWVKIALETLIQEIPSFWVLVLMLF